MQGSKEYSRNEKSPLRALSVGIIVMLEIRWINVGKIWTGYEYGYGTGSNKNALPPDDRAEHF